MRNIKTFKTTNPLSQIVFISFMLNINFPIYAQFINLESSMDLLQLIPNTTSFKIGKEFDYDGDGKNELLIKTPEGLGSKYSFIDFENQSLEHSFTGEALEDFFQFSDYEAVIRFKGEKEDRIHLDNFNWRTNRIYDPLSDDVIKLDFAIDKALVSDLDNDGYPEVLGKEAFSDTFKLFKFTNSNNYSKIIETVFESRSTHIVQLDQDLQKEIILYNSNSESLIIDPVTQETEEIMLSFNNVIELDSYSSQGNNMLVYTYNTDEIAIYDITNNEIKEHISLASQKKAAMKVIHLQDNQDILRPYFIVMNDELTLLDENLNIITVIDDLDIHFLQDSKFVLSDFDNDGMPNILMLRENIVLNYEINGLGTYSKAFQLHDQYPENYQSIGSSSELMLNFNEEVDLNHLYSHITLLKHGEATNNSFNLKSDNNCTYYIKPTSTLSEGSYSLIINEGLKSKFGNKLDLNKDMKISSTDNSDYIINFTIVEQNSSSPSIQLITVLPDSIYADSKYEVTLKIESNIEKTPFRSIKAGFENNNLTSSYPIDGILNKSSETLKILINTIGHNEGMENFKIIAETINNTKDSFIIPLKIINPIGYPFSVIGANTSHTRSQKRSEANNIFEHVWTLNTNKANQWVVGEGGFIYYVETEDNAIVKLDYTSKEIIWSESFEGKISELCIEDGVLYFANSIDGDLYFRAIYALNGSRLWTTKSHEGYSSNSAYQMEVITSEDHVLAPTPKGIFCLNKWNGQESWNRDRSYIRRNIIEYDNKVFAIGDNRLICLDINNGALLYDRESNSIPSFNGEILLDTQNEQLIYDNSDGIYAVNIETLEENWHIPAIGGSTMSILNGYIYYGNIGADYVHKADLNTGEISEAYFEYNDFDDLFVYNNYLAITTNDYKNCDFYRTDNMTYINSLENTDGSLISMVDDMLFLADDYKISAYRMQPTCYEATTLSFQACQGDTISLENKQYSSSGTYQDTIYNSDTCHQIYDIELFFSNIAISDTIISHDTEDSNGKIQFQVNGGIPPYTFQWSNGQATNNVDNLTFGLYSVTISDSIGCEITSEFTILDAKCENNGGDLDNDGYCADQDCNDNNPNINPNQVEVAYNGFDDDCDPLTLDDDLDQDGFLFVDDCNDNNPNINPNQVEVAYNGLDDDCDPLTLDDDLDQDGFLFVDDCDDTNPNINPNQVEVAYNGLDDDCDPITLDDDLDQDGFLLVDDCDDANPNINPNQVEVAYNGFDDDCDPITLDDDLDQDGFLLVDDCNDNNPNINPNQVEIPNNGIDEDCDGLDYPTSVNQLVEQLIRLYPNPASDVLIIELDDPSNFELILYDLNGKKILSRKNYNQIDISKLSEGIYLLEINDFKMNRRSLHKVLILR